MLAACISARQGLVWAAEGFAEKQWEATEATEVGKGKWLIRDRRTIIGQKCSDATSRISQCAKVRCHA